MKVKVRAERDTQASDDPFSFRQIIFGMRVMVRSVHRRTGTSPYAILARSPKFVLHLHRPKVFIIGAPRSGTTFLGDSLSSVDSVAYFHEPEPTKCAIGRVFLKKGPRTLMSLYFALQYAWLAAIHGARVQYFAEKTPRNCFIIDFLAGSFPASKFIHIIRDGRDSAASNMKKHWLDSARISDGQRDSAGYKQGNAIQFWVEKGEEARFRECSVATRSAWVWRRYTSSAVHGFTSVNPDRVLHLRYEDVVASPGDTADRMAEFLGFCRERRDQLEQALAKAHTASVGAWRQSLSVQELSEVEAECGGLLRELGYTQEPRAEALQDRGVSP